MTDPSRALTLALVLITALPLTFAAAPASLSGRITQVDVSARTMTVADAKAGAVKVLVDESTVIVLDGDESAILEDLFPGDEVLQAEVKQLASGKLLLTRATVTSRVLDDDSDDDGSDNK